MKFYYLARRCRILLLVWASALFGVNALQAQTDKNLTDSSVAPAIIDAEEDFSQYDDLSFAAEGAKRYCSPKIEGLSPAKLISVGYDYQMGYTMTADTFRPENLANVSMKESAKLLSSNGIRLGCNIPVISKTNLVWQMGFNYWEQRYKFENPDALKNPMLTSLRDNGLRTMGINTTLFKPLDDVKFLLFQGSADLNGDYQFGKFMPLRYTKYSGALIYGKRTGEKKQWGLGVARTYRVGELNYIPIIFYNSTDIANKWGTEILFPARAHVRRTFNSRNMLFAGYELEGQSYRLWRSNDASGLNLRDEKAEIRRGEIRLRMVYEFSIKDFLWMSIQAGYRINYRYNVDRLDDDREIYRAFGLASDAPYFMTNQLTNPLYLNISVNLVSP